MQDMSSRKTIKNYNNTTFDREIIKPKKSDNQK